MKIRTLPLYSGYTRVEAYEENGMSLVLGFYKIVDKVYWHTLDTERGEASTPKKAIESLIRIAILKQINLAAQYRKQSFDMESFAVEMDSILSNLDEAITGD